MTSTKTIRALWLLGAATVVLLLAQTWARAQRPGGIDFTTYLAAAGALAGGDNPYVLEVPFPYLYPAFLALVLIPLTWVPGEVALGLWFIGSVAATVWSVARMVREAYPELNRRPLTPLVSVLFLAAFPVLQSNLRNGQVNAFVLALSVLALTVHRREPAAGGAFAWAAAIATKIVPAVLMIFFVRRRRWRVLLFGIAAVAALYVLPVVAGGTHILTFQRDALASLVTGSLTAASGMEPLDFSAGGRLIDLGTPGSTAGVRLAGACLVLIVVASADWRTAPSARGDAGNFAMYLAAIPLISPKSEVHHLVFALPALAIAAAHVWFGSGAKGRAVHWTLAGAAVSYAYGLLRPSDAGLGIFLAVAGVLAAVALSVRSRAAS